MIIPDEIHRSARKTLSISVDATGRLIVRAPLRCSEARILAFIEKKSSWISVRQAKAKSELKLLPNENLDGFSFLLLGKVCEIKKFDKKRAVFDDMSYVLYVPESATGETVSKWLKKKAKEVFLEMVKVRARDMQANYKTVAVSTAKKRWGSCSANNTLRFTFRLLYAPPQVIDYVIVHELAHTFYKNHG